MGIEWGTLNQVRKKEWEVRIRSGLLLAIVGGGPVLARVVLFEQGVGHRPHAGRPQYAHAL